MRKVNIIWRIGFIFVFGAIFGTFATIYVITKRIETGDTINIGKIKIKNAHDIELPIIIESDPDGELTRKEKRKLKRETGAN